MQINTTEGIEFDTDNKVSILDSALSSGYVFEYSCKNGQCGVCKTQLLKGETEEIQPQIALTNIERSAGKILTCCCSASTDILIDSENLSALSGIKNKVLPARINTIKFLSASVVEVVLRLPPNSQFTFLEGQYIDVIGPNTVKRSYSIASSSTTNELTLIIKKVKSGILSEYWFNEAKVNDLLRIEGPKGTFFIRDPNQSLIFLATGTGIAPIKAMLEGLDTQENFDNKKMIKVFWGNREENNIVWSPKFKNINVELNYVLSKPSDKWLGLQGYVQNHAIESLEHLDNVSVYACGSNEMILSAKDCFVNAGLKENKFLSDAFLKTN